MLINKKYVKAFIFAASLAASLFICGGKPSLAQESNAPLSKQTRACVDCHKLYTPGIVEDWLSSGHARTTPTQALEKPEQERLFSASAPDKSIADKAVGCFECHGANPGTHKDEFEHFGFRIHVVVSPKDCAVCHPVEEAQFSQGKEAHAYGNLNNNALYHTLMDTVTGVKDVASGKPDVTLLRPSDSTRGQTCLGCHGMPVVVDGMKSIPTPVGIINVPVLKNWPDTGIGRVNTDGSLGACEACHPGHSFSLETARKPYICARCHSGPESPAWDVFSKSAHGAAFLSKEADWDFSHVPWRPGVDFKSPDCAACHMSLLARPDGSVIAARSHDNGARLWVRIFGLPYSHPQPKHGDTTMIINKDGLPLPTTFADEPASKYLISPAEQASRKTVMESVCLACHGSDWVDSSFRNMDSEVKEADSMVYATTKLLMAAWDLGLEDRTNPFHGPLEMQWVSQWLFNANGVRYAAAMSGAPGYQTFRHGWWQMSQVIQDMKDKIEDRTGHPVPKIQLQEPAPVKVTPPHEKTRPERRRAAGKRTRRRKKKTTRKERRLLREKRARERRAGTKGRRVRRKKGAIRRNRKTAYKKRTAHSRKPARKKRIVRKKAIRKSKKLRQKA